MSDERKSAFLRSLEMLVQETGTLVCVVAWVWVWVWVYLYAYLHTCIHAFIHAHMHSFIHTCIHIRMYSCFCFLQRAT